MHMAQGRAYAHSGAFPCVVMIITGEPDFGKVFGLYRLVKPISPYLSVIASPHGRRRQPSVCSGEPLPLPLRGLRDAGNDFCIHVGATFCRPGHGDRAPTSPLPHPLTLPPCGDHLLDLRLVNPNQLTVPLHNGQPLTPAGSCAGLILFPDIFLRKIPVVPGEFSKTRPCHFDGFFHCWKRLHVSYPWAIPVSRVTFPNLTDPTLFIEVYQFCPKLPVDRVNGLYVHLWFLNFPGRRRGAFRRLFDRSSSLFVNHDGFCLPFAEVS